MLTPLRRLALGAAAAVLLVGALTSAAHAGPPYRTWYGPAVPPAITVYPDVRVQQYAANLAVLGRAYSQVPPYALGYNPYVRRVYYGAPVYPTVPYYPAYNPYLYTNPYLNANPYLNGNPYLSPYYTP